MRPLLSGLLRHAVLAASAGLFLGTHGLAHATEAVQCTDLIWSFGTSTTLLSNGFAFNGNNTRNQTSQINAGNVAHLTLAYTHVAEDTVEKKGAPAVTQQVVYFSEGRDIVAANRITGCEYWRYAGVNRSTPLVASNAIRSSSIYYLPGTLFKPAMVFAGDYYGNLYAVNATTGKLVWKDFVGTDAARHFITGSPQVHNGTLFVPVATKEVITTLLDVFSACCFSHGLLQALDPYTGQIKWTYHATADAQYNYSTGVRGPNGVSLWGTPLIDAANNAIVVGTGQNLNLPATPNSDSIVSLDLDTGQVKWIFQSTANDAWNVTCGSPSGLDGKCPTPAGGDLDFGAPPILATLPGGGRAILAGAKNGVVYSLDPQTGALKWSRRLGAGGSLGGVHWGMAIDHQKVYVAITDVWVNKVQRLAIADLFAFQSTIGKNMGPVPDARPGLYALDLSNGSLVWEKHVTHAYEGQTYQSLYSAALSVTNDVLFAGSLNGLVKAFRTSDGTELWSADTKVSVTDVNGVTGQGGTIDSVGPIPAGTDLYVNSGYASFGGANAWQGGEGNALFVFRLP